MNTFQRALLVALNVEVVIAIVVAFLEGLHPIELNIFIKLGSYWAISFAEEFSDTQKSMPITYVWSMSLKIFIH